MKETLLEKSGGKGRLGKNTLQQERKPGGGREKTPTIRESI